MTTLVSGIYKFTMKFKVEMYALDVNENTVVARSFNGNKSQLWIVDYDRQNKTCKIWNIANNGMFLCAKDKVANSELALRDKSDKFADWEVHPIRKGHLIAPNGELLVITVDPDPLPNSWDRSVSLEESGDTDSEPSKWAAWVFSKINSIESLPIGLSQTSTRKSICLGVIPVFEDESVLVNRSSGLFKISPEHDIQCFLGATNDLDVINIVGVWPDNPACIKSQQWHIMFDHERHCFMIKQGSQYLDWTDLTDGSNLLLSSNRCYWELYCDGDGTISFCVPKTSFFLHLATYPGVKTLPLSIPVLRDLSLNAKDIQPRLLKWVVREVTSRSPRTYAKAEKVEKGITSREGCSTTEKSSEVCMVAKGDSTVEQTKANLEVV